MRPDEDVYKEYNCNGSQASFPITFTFDEEEEIQAWIRNVSLKTQSPLVNPDDFYVEGKNLITVDTWDTGYKLIMIRSTEQSQTLYLEEYGPVPSVLLERRLDKLTAMVQELQRQIGGRTILLPETYTGDPIAFPEPKDKHFLGWIGTELVNKQHVSGTATVTALMKTLLAIVSATDKDLIQYDNATASWIVQTLTEIFGALGEGNPWRHDRYTNAEAVTATESEYTPIAERVTNGNAHDHDGGDGGQVDHTKLSSIGTNTHAQVDTHIASVHRNWYKIANPPVNWLATKLDGWTADQFTPGGLEVDFSTQVPADTLAVRCVVWHQITPSLVYYRKSGDANISNTPNATSEISHLILTPSETIEQAVLWLSADYKVEFAVTDVLTDLYLSYPIEYYK